MTRSVFFVFIFLTGLAPSAHAAWPWSALSKACSVSWSRVQWGNFPAPALSNAEKVVWQKAFGPEGDFPNLETGWVSDPLLAHIYAELPSEIRERLEGSPEDLRRFNLYLSHLSAQAEVSPVTSFLWTLSRKWETSTEGKVPFKRWIAEQTAKSDPKAADAHQAEFLRQREQKRAENAWNRGFRISPPVTSLGGDRYEVRVGKRTFQGVRRGEEITLTVPRDRMAQANWNPVEDLRIERMHKAGVKSPDSYPCSLGHDGFFYPQDGNARLALDKSKTVQVTLPFPPRTESFHYYLGLKGIPSLTNEQMLRVYRGEVSLWDLLPPKTRSELELDPFEN